MSSPLPLSNGHSHSRIPRVTLDLDQPVISSLLAAHLATALLSHVLFLKNQVPLPVAQLSRLPASKSNARANKLRTELLASFDTLSSHLVSTFSALSTAVARSSSSRRKWNGRVINTTRAYMAMMLGPSVGAARARVMFAVDGLEVRVWGKREGVVGDERGDGGDGNAEDEGSREVVVEDNESDAEEPSDSDDEPDEEASDSEDEDSDPEPQHPTYRETENTLHTSSRLLARTLASHQSDFGDAVWMAQELAPTQTHILVRAPRRFSHPSWIPKQSLCAKMDGILDDFLDEERHGHPSNGTTKRKPQLGGKGRGRVEGVWISVKDADPSRPSQGNGIVVDHEDIESEQDDEMDEMIWWAWDAGKIIGFSDW